MAVDLLIGIDDTDNLESRGTGYRVRRLGALLQDANLAEVFGITRHQLFVSPLIPYTSHNSSACMHVRVQSAAIDALTAFCRDYLLRECAEGSDAGLCIAETAKVGVDIQEFGHRAKSEIFTQKHSRDLAAHNGFFLEGLTGDQGGVIGALAAVGLRQGGSDGRFIGLRGVRELEIKPYSLAELKDATAIDSVQTESFEEITDPNAGIRITEWARPVLLGGKAVLLVEQENEHQNTQWRVVPKAVIKNF